MKIICHDWSTSPTRIPNAGLILFEDDPISSPTVQALLGNGIRLQSARIPFPRADGADFGTLIAGAAARIIPSAPPPVIAIACASGSLELGDDGLRSALSFGDYSPVVVDPLTAAMAALDHIDAKSVAIVCPYSREVSTAIAGAIENGGTDVAALCYLDADNSAIPDISPDTIVASARSVATGVDAVLISCTGLDATPLIDTLEVELGIPVLTSLQVLAWRIAHILERPIKKGPGALFKGR